MKFDGSQKFGVWCSYWYHPRISLPTYFCKNITCLRQLRKKSITNENECSLYMTMAKTHLSFNVLFWNKCKCTINSLICFANLTLVQLGDNPFIYIKMSPSYQEIWKRKIHIQWMKHFSPLTFPIVSIFSCWDIIPLTKNHLVDQNKHSLRRLQIYKFDGSNGTNDSKLHYQIIH
jgi:hypothetical protein